MTEIHIGSVPENIRTWIEQHAQQPVAPSPYFAYDSNGVITGLHQGSPNMYDEGTYIDPNDGEEKPYSGWIYAGSDVVENYATAIGNNAFNDTDLASYGIPPSRGITGNITFQNVTRIGEQAFYYCNGLVSVTMPNVISIEDSAFNYCTGLTNVTIPDSATILGRYAFFNCSSMTSVTIGNGVTSIGYYAFNCCYSLTSVTIGSGIQRIGQNVFETYGSPITLTISKTVAEVEAMGQTDYDTSTNVPYSEWYLPSGSTIVCTDDTITIQ